MAQLLLCDNGTTQRPYHCTDPPVSLTLHISLAHEQDPGITLHVRRSGPRGPHLRLPLRSHRTHPSWLLRLVVGPQEDSPTSLLATRHLLLSTQHRPNSRVGPRYIQRSRVLVRGLNTQEKVSSASLKASWILARHGKPFTDAEILKDVMVSVLQELSTDKTTDALIASVKQMPLSARTAVRRIEVLSSDIHGDIICALREVDHYSLAIDESTDTTDVAQMCVYVRYFDDKTVSFQEELLFLIPLEGQTTGEILFAKLEEQFRKHSLSLEKINFIVTDGAPSMIGKQRGLVSRLREIVPNIQALHCLIHQSVLCAKLSGELKTVMDKVMRIINYIRGTSSTQHRLFRQLVTESEEASHSDLLLHNDVRWLSKGRALERMCTLLNEIKAFLQTKNSAPATEHLAQLEDKTFMANVAFLTDIFGHLNQLNLQLQGREKTIVDMVEKLEAFIKKLNLFETDMTSKRLLHFPTLKKHAPKEVTKGMVDFVKHVLGEFISRFEDYSSPKEILAFVRDPFSVQANPEFSLIVKETLPSLNEATFELQLTEFHTSSQMRSALQNAQSLCAFWLSCPEDYGEVKKLAFYVLTMFPSTYTCESTFSSMNAIKTHERNRLTNSNLENALRLKVTSLTPDIKKIVKEGKFQYSH
ncbi:SCAN domain-containing protein 3-like [Periophthalmus magnuspinnatus]|uniref:SCAN domain-containing protein 3-like n=1 Tax=Periophthalmus magnuspinnatus TaxID=409849 RepID=UPI00145A4D24|nr:SCAN domain-containing protein 3-like [Periophthalmus magnuspinnatus]